jgi:hypothetical protein
LDVGAAPHLELRLRLEPESGSLQAIEPSRTAIVQHVHDDDDADHDPEQQARGSQSKPVHWWCSPPHPQIPIKGLRARAILRARVQPRQQVGGKKIAILG